MTYSKDTPLIVERDGAVLKLTMNRPEQRNAIDYELAAAICAALDDFDADDSLSAAVLTGAGKGFCAGMDLKAFAGGGKRPWAGDRGFAGIVRKPPKKPIIAAIEGFAVAGGLEIALACDLIVASSGAKLGVPEVKRSLVAAGGALRRLPRRLPYSIALEMSLTGDPITAERARELGMVNRVAGPGAAAEVAGEMAAAIAANGPLALKATKKIVEAQFSWTDEQFWENQDQIVAPVFESEDAKEGATAFTEKRDPVWKGR